MSFGSTSENTLWSVLVQFLSARILLSNLVLEMPFSLFVCFTYHGSLRNHRRRHGWAKAQWLIHVPRHPESMQ